MMHVASNTVAGRKFYPTTLVAHRQEGCGDGRGLLGSTGTISFPCLGRIMCGKTPKLDGKTVATDNRILVLCCNRDSGY